MNKNDINKIYKIDKLITKSKEHLKNTINNWIDEKKNYSFGTNIRVHLMCHQISVKYNLESIVILTIILTITIPLIVLLANLNHILYIIGLIIFSILLYNVIKLVRLKQMDNKDILFFLLPYKEYILSREGSSHIKTLINYYIETQGVLPDDVCRVSLDDAYSIHDSFIYMLKVKKASLLLP